MLYQIRKKVILTLLSCSCALFTACNQLLQGNVSGGTENSQVSAPKVLLVHSRINGSDFLSWKWNAKRLDKTDDLTIIHFLNPTVGWIATTEGALYKTNDVGKTWQPVKGKLPQEGLIADFFFESPSLGWQIIVTTPDDVLNIEGIESLLRRTSDGGKKWQPQYMGRTIQLNKLSFVNDREGWAVGRKRIKGDTLYDNLFVLHTTDQGQHWEDVSSELNQDQDGDFVTDIYAAKSFEATILTMKGKIFNTTNGGQNWRKTGMIEGEPDQTGMRRIGAQFNSIWVLGGTDSIEGMWATLAHISQDSTWKKYKTDGIYFRDIAFLSENQLLACGSIPSDDNVGPRSSKSRNGIISYSSDGGQSWTIVYRNAQVNSINALTIVDDENIWAIGEHGLVLRLESPLNRPSK